MFRFGRFTMSRCGSTWNRDIQLNKFYDANGSKIEQRDKTLLVYYRLDEILGDSKGESGRVACTVVKHKVVSIHRKWHQGMNEYSKVVVKTVNQKFKAIRYSSG